MSNGLITEVKFEVSEARSSYGVSGYNVLKVSKCSHCDNTLKKYIATFDERTDAEEYAKLQTEKLKKGE